MPDSNVAPVGAAGPAPAASASKYDLLIAAAKKVPAAKAIVVHPCDEPSLGGAVEAAKAGLIQPTLVGPAAKIHRVAREHQIDIGKFELVDVAHSEAAAAKAVELIRAGQGELLMKGSLHTDELMRAVTASNTGLRTERRISHVFVMDVPTYAETLFITDAAVNIFPDLDAKRDIVQNAVDLFGRSDLARRAWLFSLRSKPLRRRSRRPSMRQRFARWPTAGRSLAPFSMGRLLSITQSIRRPRGSRELSLLSPVGRKSWWCPISRPATCWPKISSI